MATFLVCYSILGGDWWLENHILCKILPIHTYGCFYTNCCLKQCSQIVVTKNFVQNRSRNKDRIQKPKRDANSKVAVCSITCPIDLFTKRSRTRELAPCFLLISTLKLASCFYWLQHKSATFVDFRFFIRF